MKQLILILVLCSSAFGADRYISPLGNDLNPCISGMPCKTIAKVMSVRLPGDRVFVDAGTYDFSNLERVTFVPAGAVWIVLPSGTVPLDDKFVIWGQLPSATMPDVRVILKPGQPLQNVKWKYRRGDTSTDVLCTVNKSTTVEIVK